ncbi:MAG TPA: hypothetical protein VJ842_00100 [Pyrinomonadaceae bacterium]|nr:hypothetical protein [Pyrinomonadaceae bacterium]
MKPTKNRMILVATGALWIFMICTGIGILWSYERTPGVAANALEQWPTDSHIQHATDSATLVMLAHPHCPCTRASLGELARLMAQAQGRVKAYVLFVKPSDFPDGWEKTDLLASASAIPGVTVVRDDEGVEAVRFRAATSGQTMLYDAEGKLLFSGGITSARGHEGDNAGRAAIVSLLTTDESGERGTPVFGCPLFAESAECLTGKEVGHAKHEH